MNKSRSNDNIINNFTKSNKENCSFNHDPIQKGRAFGIDIKNTTKDSDLNNPNHSKANTKSLLHNNKITKRPNNNHHISSLQNSKDTKDLKAFPLKTQQIPEKSLLLSLEVNNTNKSNHSLITELNSTTLPLETIEEDKGVDPQYVIDYSNEITEYWKESESINIPNYSIIFRYQKKINEKSRAILIDWLAAIHYKYELLPETLYLAVTILDRYTQMTNIDLCDYQLVGIAAMLIASKYEEIYAPEIRDFIHISKKIYTKEQILKMEGKIIAMLNFDLLFVSSYRFLTRYYFISEDNNLQTFHLAQYIMEMSMMDVNIMNFSQSMRACSALYMARKLLKYKNVWLNTLKLHTGYNASVLKPCIEETVSFLQVIIKNKPNAFTDKFKTFDYSQVANVFSGITSNENPTS